MGTRNGLFRKMLMCVFAALLTAVVFTACELKDPVTESTYYINDSQANYYNKDHTTTEEAVDEFTDSITALRKYLDSESFVDTGYYMGVDFDIDILDQQNNTAGNFALRVKSYLYTYPYEDEDGNPIYKYYEDGKLRLETQMLDDDSYYESVFFSGGNAVRSKIVDGMKVEEKFFLYKE